MCVGSACGELGVDPISNYLGVSARQGQTTVDELLYPTDAVARGFPCCRPVATQRLGAKEHADCDGGKARKRDWALLPARSCTFGACEVYEAGQANKRRATRTRPYNDRADIS